ncbi:helix-turn-helix transcriptional regulator [Oceanicella sp. SM1341]|uniref:helix-turn-helix transcriptional regulator n=1 Tax=Oceanicella sp. SM1341 TaxID=1548889 RepID=UPI000E468855|nr:helix-turn-helix transcriptional regulator [Oceanicella sp. SM1341]
MSLPARDIDLCLQALGTEGFALAFSALAERLEMDQVMVFATDGARASCLLSRNFGRAGLGGRLAARYLDGWFREDPLLPELLATPPGTVALRRMADVAGRMGAEYRRLFFEAPGLQDKLTLLAAGRHLRLFVNLYRQRPGPCDPETACLAGRLALMHFDRVTDYAVPPPLAALSAREREVCLGILSGKKAEAIAGALDVAPSTVVTYRRRAYEKLGITSRAGLFAICAK